jgi:tripartite-type tricarboxylate transporter receptor subunit TctC
MAPRGTPQPVIEQLNTAINKVLQMPDMKKNLEVQGMIGSGGTPGQFDKRIRRDYERWQKLVATTGIKADVN